MTSSKTLSLLLLPVGIIAAVVLVLLSETGGFNMAVFISVATVVTVAALSSLEFGIMALIFIASIDGFLKGLSPGWHTQLLKDYLLAVCLLRWAWLSVLGHRRNSMRHPLSLPILLFAGWCVMQLFNARSASPILGLAGLRVWILWLPLFFVVYDYCRSRQQIERLILFIVVLLIPISIYGIYQYKFGLGHLHGLSSGFDVYTYSRYATEDYQLETRPPATMISAHGFASTLVMVILIGIGGVPYFRNRRTWQGVLILGLPLFGTALLLTAVRNAYGSLVMALLFLMGLIRRPDLAILTAIVGLIAVTQVGSLTGGNAMNRLNSIVTSPEYTQRRIMRPWQNAIRWAGQHPLGGGVAGGAIGRGRMLWGVVSIRDYGPEHLMPWAENDYARSMIELGIPGFLLFVWMLYSVGRTALRAYRAAAESRDRWLLAGMLSAVVSMYFRLLVGPALYGWPEAIIFWCYAAMAARLPEIEAVERHRREAEMAEVPVAKMVPEDFVLRRRG
ncbi:MAG: hypothetical protein GX131_10820 [candidate division WS1 bacterium]|nr:hypothetical protein [candidate division WS1 bacterium]